MMQCRINHHTARGISTTRGSDRNWRKYGRTAAAVGASGVPRLTSTTAVLAITSCEYASFLWEDIFDLTGKTGRHYSRTS